MHIDGLNHLIQLSFGDAEGLGGRQRTRWFHRGWEATANGQALPVFRAYGINLGVIVPPGEQEVVFRFAPPELRLGLLSLAMGLLSALVLILVALRKRFLASPSGAST